MDKNKYVFPIEIDGKGGLLEIEPKDALCDPKHLKEYKRVVSEIERLSGLLSGEFCTKAPKKIVDVECQKLLAYEEVEEKSRITSQKIPIEFTIDYSVFI